MRRVFKLSCVWLLAASFTVAHSVESTASCGYDQLIYDLRNALNQASPYNCKNENGMGAVVAQLVAELSSSKDNLNVMKISQQTLNLELQSRKSELQTMKSSLDAAESKQKTMESELQTTKAELQIMKSELQTMKTELQTAKAELQTVGADLGAANSDLRSPNLQRQTMDGEVYRPFDTELQSLHEELDMMKAELEVAKRVLNTSTTDQSAFKQTPEANVTGDAPTRFQTVSGSTFVRWGRKSCPANTTLVYSGVAGGKSYKHSGGGTNGLCLTRSPQFDNTQQTPSLGYLYGAEYQHIHGHHDHDVPCSVCLAPQSSTIMVPATLTCPPGWTPQYSGHLTSERHIHSGGEYLCLDGSPEDDSNGIENDNGFLFHYVVTVCGSLPCPPYINDKVVTCVVCSK